MATEFDATEFVDEDFQNLRRHPFPASPATMTAPSEDPQRAPTREEVDSRISELQTKLADLKREQSEIERERAAHEETRRRQMEFATGREELIRDLSRGIQLLEEREIAVRRDAEQMAKSLIDLKDSLAKLQAIQDASWTRENLSTELSRALGVADHARLEWNSARLKFPVLSGAATPEAGGPPQTKPRLPLEGRGFVDLCKLGLAFTWPIALAALAIFLVLLFK
ncbi:MAG: hypothetical protein HZA90_03605 [Verrucomicrobia bacterium]|nr:hypothetical protein [Verrucomicrobiota bacterium]